MHAAGAASGKPANPFTPVQKVSVTPFSASTPAFSAIVAGQAAPAGAGVQAVSMHCMQLRGVAPPEK